MLLGFAAIFVRLAAAPGTVTAFYRMLVASMVITVPLIMRMRSRSFQLAQSGIKFALLSGLFVSLNLAFWTTGVMIGGATNPTLMLTTAPIWVGLGSMLFFQESHNRRFWFGVLSTMLGAIIVLGFDLSFAYESGLGTFFGILAAVFIAVYMMTIQKGRIYLEALPFFWITTISSMLILLLYNLISHQQLSGYSTFSIINFVALGILVQIGAWFSIIYAQGILPASIVSPTLLGQPVVTAIVAVPLLGEPISPFQVIGAFIVISGVIIVHRSR
jgi:drug/metabolite transporter (DMT)-like permease